VKVSVEKVCRYDYFHKVPGSDAKLQGICESNVPNTDFIRHFTHKSLNWSPLGTKLPAGVDENSSIGHGALK
jgi:hypothetical protein